MSVKTPGFSRAGYGDTPSFSVVKKDYITEEDPSSPTMRVSIGRGQAVRGVMASRGRSQLALKVVSRPAYYEGEFVPQEIGLDGHSLHDLGVLPFDTDPGLTAAIIHNFSRSGDIILDPICRSGATGVEALLGDRSAILADTDPLATLMAKAKTEPADLTEVALWLQMTPLKAPVICDNYESIFSPFFDINTYREVSYVRRALLKKKGSPLSFFLSALTLSILHGRGAGNLSVYTPSEVVLTPEQQQELNFRRRQAPDYRAIAPRLLRKSAMVLQDGLPSAIKKGGCSIVAANSRSLGMINTGRVDLCIFNPVLPRHIIAQDSNWLKRWFAGLSIKPEKCSFYELFFNPNTWLSALNESLIELARVTRTSGRVAVVCDRYFKNADSDSDADEVRALVANLVESELGLYFEPECYMAVPQKRATITGREKAAGSYRYRSCPDGVLVLRRK